VTHKHKQKHKLHQPTAIENADSDSDGVREVQDSGDSEQKDPELLDESYSKFLITSNREKALLKSPIISRPKMKRLTKTLGLNV